MRAGLVRSFSLVGLVFALSGTARADGFIVVQRAVAVPPGHPPFAPLAVESHQVRVAIRDQVAVTEVDQLFRNPNAQRLEGEYLFPIPKNAAIDRFTMEIDGKEQTAELIDAERARRIYEDIVRSMRDPALLEYGDRGVFRVRVFPIEPHGTKRVKLKYTQLLRSDGGAVGFSYPLNTEKFSSAPIDRVSLQVHVESRDPLKSIWSPSHEVEVTRQGAKAALVGFEQTKARPDTDFELFYTAEEKSPVGLGVLTYRGEAGDDGYFLLLASPGALQSGNRALEKDVVFAVDTSGSMAGDKLEQLKRALRHCIDGLGSGDRFEIVRFSTEAEPLFGSLVDASDANRDRARGFVRDFRAVGGTAIGEALAKALAPAAARESSRPFVVVFVTDGLATVGETDAARLVAAAKGAAGARNVRIFSFGVGSDVDTRLLDELGNATRGFSQYVGPREDIERKVSSFYARIEHPAMTGLALRAEGEVRLTKLYPQPLPDLFHGDQLVVLGRYSGTGSGRVVLEGEVAGEKRAIAETVTFPAAAGATEYRFLPRLWATRRVGHLLEEMRLHGENAELRDEVTQLARRHGIVTPYTSYLILEDERRKELPATLQSFRADAGRAGERQALAKSFDGLTESSSGRDAVAGAKVSGELKRASNLAAPLRAMDELAEDAAVERLASSPAAPEPFAWSTSQVQRRAAGKTFFQNGTRWIDGEAAERPRAKPVQVVFGSPEYFTLSRKHRDAGAWLAQGRQVVVVIDDVLYEIVDDPSHP